MRIRAVLAALCLALAVSAVPAAASAARASTKAPSAPSDVNWPQFRFNDNHTGFNPSETVLNRTNVPRLQLAWEAQLGKLVDSSSPAVVNGVAYIASSDGRVWAYPANGCGHSLCTSPLWSSTSVAQIIVSNSLAR